MRPLFIMGITGEYVVNVVSTSSIHVGEDYITNVGDVYQLFVDGVGVFYSVNKQDCLDELLHIIEQIKTVSV